MKEWKKFNFYSKIIHIYPPIELEAITNSALFLIMMQIFSDTIYFFLFPPRYAILSVNKEGGNYEISKEFKWYSNTYPDPDTFLRFGNVCLGSYGLCIYLS